MTKYIVKSTTIGTDLVSPKDTYVIGRGVSVNVTDDDAFFGDAAFYGNKFRVRGSVETSGPNDAFLIQGVHTRIAVSGTGSITSEDAAIELVGSHSRVDNNGTITAGTFGIKLDDMVGLVKNSGTITTDDTGIYLAGRGGEIENYGVVNADRAIRQVSVAGDITSVFNSGIVNGAIYSFAGSAANDTVLNRGELNGDVRLAGGNDVFHNTGGGSVKGDIVGGAGRDTFDIEDSTVSGSIFGGKGNDTYILDNSNPDIAERAHGGKDTVVSSVSYTLGNNLEVLRLLGTKSIDGTGNSDANAITGNVRKNDLAGEGGNDLIRGLGGNDVIDGGTGNDRLFGGGGADKFVFATHDGHDKIADFQAGVDHVNLSGLQAVTDFHDLMDHHIRASGHNLVIHAGADRLLLLHVAKSDLHHGDFIF